MKLTIQAPDPYRLARGMLRHGRDRDVEYEQRKALVDAYHRDLAAAVENGQKILVTKDPIGEARNARLIQRAAVQAKGTALTQGYQRTYRSGPAPAKPAEGILPAKPGKVVERGRWKLVKKAT